MLMWMKRNPRKLLAGGIVLIILLGLIVAFTTIYEVQFRSSDKNGE